MSERLLLSWAEAAMVLGIKKTRLSGEIDHGRLRYVLVGARRKFAVSEIEAYIERSRRAAAGIAAVQYEYEFGPPAPVPVPPYTISARAMLGRARSGAKLRGKRFALTERDMLAMIARAAGRCEVSGIPFSGVDVAGRQPFAPSIDRIDSSKGYSAENCRLVCYAVNIALHEWGDAVLRRIAHGIVEKGDA